MNVLITGANGFIAAHLARRLLAHGHVVHGLVRSTSNTQLLTGLDVPLHAGDVTDADSLEQAFRGMDIVFHLAGLTKAVRQSDLFRVNVEGTQHVAEACVRCQVPRLLHVSSLAAAGPSRAAGSTSPIPKTESELPKPVSNYGRSKWGSEQALTRYADRLGITIVRPPIVFGEGDAASLQMFVAIKRTGLHAVPYPASRKFSVIHASDLADLMIQASTKGETLAVGSPETELRTGPFRLGQGRYFADVGWQPTYAELGKNMARAMDTSCRVLIVPRVVLHAVGLVGDATSRLTGKATFLSRDKAREATSGGSWTCDGTKARAAFDFQPAICIEERLSQTYQWYREQRWI